MSDAELNERLLEVLEFTPCDNFDHCRRKLRQGFTYVVWRTDKKAFPKLLVFLGPDRVRAVIEKLNQIT